MIAGVSSRLWSLNARRRRLGGELAEMNGGSELSLSGGVSRGVVSWISKTAMVLFSSVFTFPVIYILCCHSCYKYGGHRCIFLLRPERLTGRLPTIAHASFYSLPYIR